MRILFIGDIVGKSGRRCVSSILQKVKKKYNIDFVIANGENATHGKGLIENHYTELLNAGIDCITLGNHYNSKNEIKNYIGGATQLIRPANLKEDFPGVGTAVFMVGDYSVRVTNLLGMAFMTMEVNNPFEILKNIVDNETKADIHIVDFHAEATGEKQSLAYYFDGKVSAFIGTHTHVQTRDARILKLGTGFMCDVGMVGPYNGVLGSRFEQVFTKIWLNGKAIFEIDENDTPLFNAVVLDIDENSGICNEIIPISIVNNHM